MARRHVGVRAVPGTRDLTVRHACRAALLPPPLQGSPTAHCRRRSVPAAAAPRPAALRALPDLSARPPRQPSVRPDGAPSGHTGPSRSPCIIASRTCRTSRSGGVPATTTTVCSEGASRAPRRLAGRPRGQPSSDHLDHRRQRVRRRRRRVRSGVVRPGDVQRPEGDSVRRRRPDRGRGDPEPRLAGQPGAAERGAAAGRRSSRRDVRLLRVRGAALAVSVAPADAE